jgi:cation:H+ antiporter
MWRLKLKREFIMENYVTLIVTFIFMFIVWYDWMITRSESALMLLVFCLYLYFLYLQEHKHKIKEHPHRDSWNHTPRKDAWWIVLWFIGVFIWSSTALESLQQIVIITWFSGWLLAIMTLWVASALPEFITSISALRKWAADVGLWTLIWSNIVNPLMWIWAGWIITWYAVPQWFTGIDLPIQILVSCVLLLRIIHHKRIIPKYAGYILIGTYFFYLLARMYLYPTDFGNY